MKLFFFLPGIALCAESLSISDKLYAAPRLFYNYLGDRRKTYKQTNNIKARSWCVKKAKTDRDLSANHEGQ